MMSIFSRLLSNTISRNTYKHGTEVVKTKNNINQVQIITTRYHGDHPKTLHITPSRFQWHKTKDMMHLYFMVGAIPITIGIFLTNVFVGPAELTPIPEGYTPKHWEYQKHPISRFIARYIWNSPQQDYEKMMHYMYEAAEKAELRKLEDKVKKMMGERGDYQAYYYKPVTAKYLRAYKKVTEDIVDRVGDFNED